MGRVRNWEEHESLFLLTTNNPPGGKEMADKKNRLVFFCYLFHPRFLLTRSHKNYVAMLFSENFISSLSWGTLPAQLPVLFCTIVVIVLSRCLGCLLGSGLRRWLASIFLTKSKVVIYCFQINKSLMTVDLWLWKTCVQMKCGIEFCSVFTTLTIRSVESIQLEGNICFSLTNRILL